MASRALVIAVCLLAAGCQASLPEPRALSRGFEPAGVVAPYDDGKLHLAAGRYGLAIDRFGQALARDRGSVDALNGLAIAYARLGRLDVARAYFERALQLDAFSVLTLNNYGRALIEQGRLQDAAPFLQLALNRASQAELTVVAANVDRIRRARPPALVAALRGEMQDAPLPGRRLIRLASNRYRLETPEPSSQPQPAFAARQAAALSATLEARQRPPRAEAHARVPVGVAGGVGAPGRALAAVADLKALAPHREKLAVTPQLAGSRTAILSASWARGRATAPALALGEPT
jgi:tetratricopeptide (TPR) repeat protein